ncbi:alpha/beta hydrolase [Salinisphaera sp. SPP-AMP-43]|uniref:alpha/beta fold hydrolase n=1 Tax=Salinisphaera sp. SPP-AMP-43 TaxID=3121288 RepID=UPI003C6E8902
MTEIPELPAAVDGERITFDSNGWTLSYYLDIRAGVDETPLLLIHSINAAASAYEVKPIYEHYQGRRAIAAIDLPGYGFSERWSRRYTPRLMTDALHAWVEHIVERTGHQRVDALACSVACEYLARAASERPDRYRSLALVSPVGVEPLPASSPQETTRGRPWLYQGLCSSTSISRTLFRALASRPSIRYFLKKTWGGSDVDKGLVDYAYTTAQQPGARHAPWSFLSGYLLSSDAADLYRRLGHPVWVAYGKRSDFADQHARDVIADQPDARIVAFDAGALPHFQRPAEFFSAYDAFLNGQLADTVEPAAGPASGSAL